MEGFSNSGRAGRQSYGPQRPPCPAFEKGHRTSPTPSGARSEELKDLLGRASISEEHRMLMNTVIGRILSTESGLYEAARSLLTGFEVRKKVYLLVEPHIENAPCINSSP